MTKVSFKTEIGKIFNTTSENMFDRIDNNHSTKLVEMVLVNQLDITDILKKYKGGAVLPTTLVQ